MKAVTIIGASGYVGTAILREALNRGYRVKAIVRHPGKITIEDNKLEVVRGDVTSVPEVSSLVKGAEAVISAFNPGWKNPNIYNDTLHGYQAIIEGIKLAGVKRLLVVGGAGRLYIAPGLRLVDSGKIPKQLLDGVKGLAEV